MYRSVALLRQAQDREPVERFMGVKRTGTPVCRSTSPACAKPLRRRQGAQAQGPSLQYIAPDRRRMKRAKIEDKSWSSETVQKNGNREGQGEEGFCEAYPDQKIGESQKRSSVSEIRRITGRQRGKETDSLSLNFPRGYCASFLSTLLPFLRGEVLTRHKISSNLPFLKGGKIYPPLKKGDKGGFNGISKSWCSASNPSLH